MTSVKQCVELTDRYNIESEKLKKLREELKKLSNDIDLDEIKNNLSYKQCVELYSRIHLYINDKIVLNELHKIIAQKGEAIRLNKHEVYHYPELSEATFLDESSKKEVDELLYEMGKYRYISNQLSNYPPELIDFLYNKKIVSKSYVFPCNCSNEECDTDYMSEDVYNKLSSYWKDCSSLTNEEHKEMNFGCWEKGCWHGEGYEVCNKEDFDKYCTGVIYKVAK